MRKVLIFLIGVFLLVQIPVITFAYNIPAKVKIGLFYGSTAVSAVKISAKSGLVIGENTTTGFKELFNITSDGAIIVRKDAYFVKNSSRFTEIKPSDTSPGEKIGPYHVQIGGSYDSFQDVKNKIDEIKEDGLEAYPYYDGKWHVWYGMFADSSLVQKSIDSELKKVVGDIECSVIEPDSRRVVLNTGNQVGFVFEGGNSYLGIKPDDTGDLPLININDKLYRGEVEIRRYSTSDMTVINILSLEEYLYGVVPREIGASSPIEALKAQAVVARNYSVNNMGKNAKWGFDMTNTVSDQAYGGYEWEKERSNKSIDETKGKLLMYDGKPASVFYFSTSGGRTEDVKNVWNSKVSYPYLVSVEDKYEPPTASKAKWEVTLTPEQIKQSLKAIGVDLGDVLAVRPLEYSEAGRVVKLQITGTKDEKTFEKAMCRTALGQSVLSQWFTVASGSSSTELSAISADGGITKISTSGLKVKTADGISAICPDIYIKGADGTKQAASGAVSTSGGFKISGRGWGHGVGMSQVGAIGMGNAGFDYQEILQWYFKGTDVE